VGLLWLARLLRLRILARSVFLRFARVPVGVGPERNPRDVYVHPRRYRVSFKKQAGLVYHHLYTHKEFLSDVESAG